MNSAHQLELNRSMAALAQGEREAFDRVFALAWPMVQNLCLRLLPGSPDAEDAAQQALLKVFSRAHEYQAGLPALIPWILTFAAFECRTQAKKTRRRREEYAQEGDSHDINWLATFKTDEVDSPEQLHSQKQLAGVLETVLTELSEVDRESILASFYELPRPDIPGATFRKRYERAMSRLKRVWEAKYESA